MNNDHVCKPRLQTLAFYIYIYFVNMQKDRPGVPERPL